MTAEQQAQEEQQKILIEKFEHLTTNTERIIKLLDDMRQLVAMKRGFEYKRLLAVRKALKAARDGRMDDAKWSFREAQQWGVKAARIVTSEVRGEEHTLV